MVNCSLKFVCVGTGLLDGPAAYSYDIVKDIGEFVTLQPPAGYFLAAEQESTQRSRLRGGTDRDKLSKLLRYRKIVPRFQAVLP